MTAKRMNELDQPKKTNHTDYAPLEEKIANFPKTLRT